MPGVVPFHNSPRMPVNALGGMRLRLHCRFSFAPSRFATWRCLVSLTCPSSQPNILAKCPSPSRSSARPFRTTASSRSSAEAGWVCRLTIRQAIDSRPSRRAFACHATSTGFNPLYQGYRRASFARKACPGSASKGQTLSVPTRPLTANPGRLPYRNTSRREMAILG